jgi:uncharacterized membrane protein
MAEVIRVPTVPDMTVTGSPSRAPLLSGRTSRTRRVGWVAMVLLGLFITVYALPYLSGNPDTFFQQQRLTYMAQLTPLMLHVAGAVVALSLGPWQFVRRLRSRWPRVHRVVGRVYVVAVLATGAGGLMLAPTTYTGRLAGLAFALLAVGTLGSTAMAFVAIRRRQIARHQVWMTRSYAFIFTGVSFRLGLILLPLLGLSFNTAYAVSAWIAWPINLAVAEVLLRRRRRPSRRAAPTPTTDRVIPAQPTACLSKGGSSSHSRFLDHLHGAGKQSR